MARNDGVDARKKRMHGVVEAIIGTLNEAKKNSMNWIPLKKTFTEIEWNTGLTRQKVILYAGIGVQRGIYVLDEKNDQIRFAES
jgi:hypothetical protein